ncbi:hypothetical protein [Salsuginibacillus kocurii]|uniref:hypothetical protein n=1 Tax=Salsuginibacillus kocurii TaxID=427078 RepID=UPI0012EA13EC|nr:hypothetical protein [Salsuginibacillus kocurii]
MNDTNLASYSTIYKHVAACTNQYKYCYGTSPELKHVAQLLGYSEERILESMEFGRPTTVYLINHPQNYSTSSSEF